MAGEGASVEGVDRAERAYQGIADDARNMSEPHRRIAQAGADAARNRAPVRTGALDTSIEGRGTEQSAELVVGVPYWRAQEFGTRYVQGRRFMRAGIEAMRSEAAIAYPQRIQKAIEDHT